MVRIKLFLPNWRTSTKSKNVWRWNERIHSKFQIDFAKGAYYFFFQCDTKMPGCENVCYNEFLPFSMDRLWSLEMIAIFSPTVIFILFAG